MKVAVVGGGSWGTAIAKYCAEQNFDVWQWAYEPEVVDEINNQRTNEVFLPGVQLPESLNASGDLSTVLRDAKIVFSVIPTQFIRSVATSFQPYLTPGVIIISASKGIENETLKLPTEIYRELLDPSFDYHLAAFAGPSFAKEVARNHPTAIVVASANLEIAEEIQSAFSSEVMRIYTTTDVVGVEICGSVKNVIALASGAVAGLGFGDNTRAALITRGVSEISRLVKLLGGSPFTVAGMAGLGDMVLTCTSRTSRNYSVGYKIGEGQSLEEITSSMRMVAEGVKTTKSINSLCKQKNIELPISNVIYSVLYEGLEPLEAARQLMGRELKQEWESEAE